MVTVIHQSESLRNALNYNEHKLEEGKAACLLAVNYPKEPEDLNFYQKLHRLTNQAALRPRTKVNSVHISINFEPSEKLASTTLKEIAQIYMDRIGFGGQPYLVYEHRDAGHPHLHVVTTNIRDDGKRISLHNLGKYQSEKARKAIEEEFGLIKAQDRKNTIGSDLKAVTIKKVLYGRSDTRRAIMNVLDVVLDRYKYTSLEELNAVLRTANVQAGRGSKTSRTYQRGGLFYQVLNENRKPVGVPIKASAFYSKATLKCLELKYEGNMTNRLSDEKRIKLAVDWYFLKSKAPSNGGLQTALAKEQITLVQYLARDGRAFGVSYVDHKTGAVFKGSDLGKEYGANGIDGRMNTARTTPHTSLMEQKQDSTRTKMEQSKEYKRYDYLPVLPRSPSKPSSSTSPAEEPSLERPAGLPVELRTEEKKKRKRKRLRM